MKFVIPYIYDSVKDGFGDQAIVTRDSKKGILLMNTGKLIVPVEYDDIRYYFYGPDCPADCYSCTSNGKYGIIDSTGRIIIPCIYDEIWISIDSKEAYVKLNDKWGFMYPRGHLVTPIKYDSYRTFFPSAEQTNMQCFTLSNINYFIDTLGNIINENDYDFDETFYFEYGFNYNSNRLIVGKEGKWGIIDYQNKVIIPLVYDTVEQYRYNLF